MNILYDERLDGPLPEVNKAELLKALQHAVPDLDILWREDELKPYECDGLSAYRNTPMLVALAPGVFGLFEPHTDGESFIRQVGALWLALGVGGLLFRTVHLFFIADVQTGLAWMTKILTDPFHDIKLYHKAPLFLLKGQLIDPGIGHR